MKNFKKTLSILLVFALVFTSMISFTAKTTDAKVKSIKVAKKATIVVGQKQTFKVKIKTTGKTSKKFTVKASKKKIVKVKKKSKKIVVTGLKPGKVTLTIKSKANKKKKKKIKITVKKKPVKNTDATLDVKAIMNDVFAFSFSKKVNLTPDNLTVMAKQNPAGKFITPIKVYDISTDDQKNYTVVLNTYPRNASILQFTVKGVNKSNIVKELTVYEAERRRTVKEVYTFDTSDYVDLSFDMEDYVGSYYGRVKGTKGIPDGVKYSTRNNRIFLQGNIKNVGVYTSYIYMEDDMGVTYTLQITFVVGNANHITVYVPEKTGVAYNEGADLHKFGGTSYIYVAGGSGEYNYNVIDKAGIFNNVINEYDGSYYWNSNTSKPGTYNGLFEVVDKHNASLQAYGTAKVVVAKAVKVTGKVTGKTGKPIKDAYVYADATGDVENFESSAYSNNQGVYNLFVAPGQYDIACSRNHSIKYAFKKSIKGSTTLNFQLNLYQVKIKSNNAKVVASTFDEWYDGNDDYMGYGDTVFLKPGNHSLTCVGFIFPSEYTAKASFKVSGDMTVTANVTIKAIPEIGLGTTTVEVGSLAKYWAFKAPLNGTYSFQSKNNTVDPYAVLYDSEGNDIDDDDDSAGNFNFYMEDTLEYQKTYYLRVESINSNTGKIDIEIKKN